ncbi:MAG: transglutaminase domain-containing protein [Pirellula sp.]
MVDRFRFQPIRRLHRKYAKLRAFATSGVLGMSITVALVASTLGVAQEPTGASKAFTSQDPIVLQSLRLIQSGDFLSASRLLDQDDATRSQESRKAASELAEIMRRIRFEYSLRPTELLLKVKKFVPDATLEDATAWAEESRSRHRSIDGQTFYFRREPQNIFLFSKEAIRRRALAGNAPPLPAWRLTDHLANVIAQAANNQSPEVLPVKHRFTHTITLRANHPKIKQGSTVRVWMPYPQEYRQQKDVRLVAASPQPKVIAPNGVDGNPVSGGAQRTIYFEQAVDDPTKPLVFKEVVEYQSFAYCPKLEQSQVQPLPREWGDAYLVERPPHIVFVPEIRKEVESIIGDETNPLLRAQKIFRWVSTNIPWNAEDEYCIIPSFAVKGFSSRCGDCGIQNTLFITMCRIAGIPARWQSGFETKPGEEWGMHDWAEIYIAPWGWLPADASYGIQQSDDRQIADFFCGHQDSYRLIVNLDWGRELFPPKQSLRSEPADFQRGEVEVDGLNLYYDEWTSKSEVER